MSDVIDKPPEVLPVVVEKTATKRPRLYQIFLSHSGLRDISENGSAWVPEGSYNVLREVFAKTDDEAIEHLAEVHDRGVSVIFESTKEVAETKTAQAIERAAEYGKSNSLMKHVVYVCQPIGN